MRRRVLAALGAGLDPIPVENPAHPGTPDLNFGGAAGEGWIELKQLARWPKGDATVVAIEHFAPHQRLALRRRWRAGGAAFLLLQVGRRDWLLFHGDDAAQHVGRVPRAELERRACRVWRAGLPADELRAAVTARDHEECGLG